MYVSLNWVTSLESLFLVTANNHLIFYRAYGETAPPSVKKMQDIDIKWPLDVAAVDSKSPYPALNIIDVNAQIWQRIRKIFEL